jgi:hypothetical protein
VKVVFLAFYAYRTSKIELECTHDVNLTTYGF